MESASQLDLNINSASYLREADAAIVVSLAPSTLAKMRANGGGPPFVKIGRAVRYPSDELTTWLEKRVRRFAPETMSAA